MWKLLVHVASLLTTISWLLIYPTIWALAAHSVISSIYAAVSSYVIFKGRRPRFCLDSVAVKEMYSFGRWVLVATALTFLARQGDSLIISKIVTPAQLGIFSIGATLAKLIGVLTGTLGRSLLMPLFSNLKSAGTAILEQQLMQIRYILFILSLPIILVTALFGSELVGVLYDPRYHEAGWITQVIALGSTFGVAASVLQPLNLAFGDSYRNMWRVFFQAIVLLGCMFFGNMLAGFYGLVFGLTVAQAIDYFVVRMFVFKYRVGGLASEMFYLSATTLIILCYWFLFGWPAPKLG